MSPGPAVTALRVLHLNSRLSGGGTDDRSVRIAHALQQLGHTVWLLGPGGREFSAVARELGLAFQTAPVGPLKLPFVLRIARFVRQQGIQILHARHGNDYWPAILAARLSGARPKVVLSRHLAKNPGSWLSRRFLLGQCDAMLAVSHFVAKVLREGHADPAADNPERHWRPPPWQGAAGISPGGGAREGGPAARALPDHRPGQHASGAGSANRATRPARRGVAHAVLP